MKIVSKPVFLVGPDIFSPLPGPDLIIFFSGWKLERTGHRDFC